MPKIAVAFCCDAPARYQMGYRRCSPLVCMATAFALVVHTATAQLSRGSSGFGSNSGIGLGTKSGGILGNLGSGFGSLESTLGSFGAGGAPVIGTTFGSLRQPVAPALGSLPSNGMLGQEIKQLPGALDASSLPLGSAFGSLHLPPRPTQNACGGITAAGSPEAVDLSGVAKLSSERPPTAPGPLPSGLQFGNSLSGALGSSMRDSSRPNINELQNQAVDNPQVDALCPGKVRTSTDVGADCWKKIWISGGCREENVPKYEQWHQVQSLEVLVADVVQWSNLPDDLHRQGCYGSVGPPPQQPTPSIQNFGVAASSPQDTIPSGHFARAAASEDELAQLIQNAGRRPIFLEMWTKSCGFCNIMFPVFEMLAEKYRGRAYFRTVDVERIPEIVSAFRVDGLPTFKAILNGQLAQEMDGADAGGLEKMIVSTVHTADLNDVHLSSDDLLAFLRRHNPEDDISPEQVEVMLQSRVDDIPKFLQELEETYSATPRTSGGFIAEGVQSMVASCSRRAHVRDLSDSELLAEIRDLQNEVNRREFQKAESTTNPCKLSRSSSSVDPDTHVERLVVLGGGPAGLAAALYGARAGLCPLLVSPLVGGQLMAKGVNVENYPGIVQSRGSAIIQDMRAQAAGFFVEQLETIVLSVDLSKRPFFLKLNSSKVPSIRAESLIVATGSESRWLGVKGESELRGVGVSSCAACDGPLYRGKNCVVVGGGDAAMEEALLLARLCDSVTLIHRRNHFRAAPILSNRVLQHPSIKIRWSSEVEEFQSEDVGKGNVLAQLLVRNVISGELSQIPADGAFVAIGHDPNTKIFEGQLSIDIFTGHIETFDRSTRSSVDGVFVAGDVADPTYRQAITSAASGAAAAIDAERWLSSNGDVEIRHELNLGTLNSCHSHPCDNNGEELVQPVFDEPHGIFDQPAQFADASHAITDILPGEQEISVESLNASDPHEFQGNLQTLSNHSTNISESLSLDQETLSPVHEFADIVLDVEDEQKEQFGMAPDVKTSDSIKLPISDEAQHAHGRLEDGLHASQLELQDQPSDLRISDNVSNTSDGCNATLDAKETLGDEPTLARLETTQQVESSLREMMHEQLEFGEDVFSSNLSEPNARRDVEVTQDMHARSVVNESSEVQGSQDVQNTTAELSNIPLEDMEQIGEVGARSTSSVNDNVTTPSSNRTETMGKKDDKAENDISVDKHDDEKSAESLNELLKVRPQIIESDKTAQGTKAVRDVNVESSTTKKSQKKGKRKRRKSESR